MFAGASAAGGGGDGAEDCNFDTALFRCSYDPDLHSHFGFGLAHDHPLHSAKT